MPAVLDWALFIMDLLESSAEPYAEAIELPYCMNFYIEAILRFA